MDSIFPTQRLLLMDDGAGSSPCMRLNFKFVRASRRPPNLVGTTCDIVGDLPMSEIALVYDKRVRTPVVDNFRSFALEKLARHQIKTSK
jgi:hypothetical protein